jgi:hypothetical protein
MFKTKLSLLFLIIASTAITLSESVQPSFVEQPQVQLPQEFAGQDQNPPEIDTPPFNIEKLNNILLSQINTQQRNQFTQEEIIDDAITTAQTIVVAAQKEKQPNIHAQLQQEQLPQESTEQNQNQPKIDFPTFNIEELKNITFPKIDSLQQSKLTQEEFDDAKATAQKILFAAHAPIIPKNIQTQPSQEQVSPPSNTTQSSLLPPSNSPIQNTKNITVQSTSDTIQSHLENEWSAVTARQNKEAKEQYMQDIKKQFTDLPEQVGSAIMVGQHIADQIINSSQVAKHCTIVKEAAKEVTSFVIDKSTELYEKSADRLKKTYADLNAQNVVQSPTTPEDLDTLLSNPETCSGQTPGTFNATQPDHSPIKMPEGSFGANQIYDNASDTQSSDISVNPTTHNQLSIVAAKTSWFSYLAGIITLQWLFKNLENKTFIGSVSQATALRSAVGLAIATTVAAAGYHGYQRYIFHLETKWKIEQTRINNQNGTEKEQYV